MATDNDQRTKEVHAAADKHKRNLAEGKDVRVATGDEAAPTERVDPFNARKAIFAHANAERDAQAAVGGSVSEVADERIRLMELEAAGVDVTDPDAVREAMGQKTYDRTPDTRGDRTLHLKKPDVKKDSTSGDGYVSLDFNGNTISVAKVDVDRAGGVDEYVRRRAENDREIMRARELDERDRKLADALAESNRLREELQAARLAGQGKGPATTGADPASEGRKGLGAAGVDDEALAKELASQIYSGDESVTAKAVLQILRLSRARGEPVDEQAIVERVKAEASKAPAAQPAAQTTTRIDPALALMNQQINEMAKADFGELVANNEARVAAFERFRRLVRLPENRERLAIDVAREAMEQIEQIYSPQRQKVIERKRGLPSGQSADGVNTLTPDSDERKSGSDIVAQLAASRQFGRRAH